MRTSKFRVLYLADEYGPAHWHYLELPEDIKGETWMARDTFDWNTWGEYTGWLDHKKQEVYEGDIVQVDTYYGVVVWDTVNDGWRIAYESSYNLRNTDMVVVGNIYETPKLMPSIKMFGRPLY